VVDSDKVAEPPRAVRPPPVRPVPAMMLVVELASMAFVTERLGRLSEPVTARLVEVTLVPEAFVKPKVVAKRFVEVAFVVLRLTAKKLVEVRLVPEAVPKASAVDMKFVEVPAVRIRLVTLA
jgi:hypothetical protein